MPVAFRAAMLRVLLPSFFSRFAEYITSRANGKRFLDYDERNASQSAMEKRAYFLMSKTPFCYLNFLPISFATSVLLKLDVPPRAQLASTILIVTCI